MTLYNDIIKYNSMIHKINFTIEKLMENKEETKDEEKIKQIDEELNEIKAILPDIESKVFI